MHAEEVELLYSDTGSNYSNIPARFLNLDTCAIVVFTEREIAGRMAHIKRPGLVSFL